jgi:hypothetical protein
LDEEHRVAVEAYSPEFVPGAYLSKIDVENF